MKITLEAQKECRRYVKNHGHIGRNNLRIEIIDGSEPPHIVGEGFMFKTTGGKIINYPTAYSKKGFSNMVYVKSTIHIAVGKYWIREAEIDIEQLRIYKVNKKIAHRDVAKFSYIFC